jgi:hypothetical protein
MKNVKEACFPFSHVAAMYLAITQGGEGEVAKQMKNATQVWHNNLYTVLASIDLQETIRKEAHPAAYRILQKYGKECRTRFRPYKHSYNGRTNGLGQCTMNSILEALDTGMELWSGYVCFVGARFGATATSWHLWNVDHQGFVYDTTYGAESVFCRYYGVRLDPYVAYETTVEKEVGLFRSMFLYWEFFTAFHRACRRHVGGKYADESFTAITELAFKQIAIIP